MVGRAVGLVVFKSYLAVPRRQAVLHLAGGWQEPRGLAHHEESDLVLHYLGGFLSSVVAGSIQCEI
jgi:hypothetical protein